MIQMIISGGDVFLRGLEWPKLAQQILQARGVATQILEYPKHVPEWLGPQTTTQVSTHDHPFISALKISDNLLPGFSTVNLEFASAIVKLLAGLVDYSDDQSRKRPYNILMLAPPGSGKSHFIRCIANKLELPTIIGNLSVREPAAVLGFVVDEARNYKAQDKIPLIFLDEVD